MNYQMYLSIARRWVLPIRYQTIGLGFGSQIFGKLILQLEGYQKALFDRDSPVYLQLNDTEKLKIEEKKYLLMKAISDLIDIYNDGDDMFKL